VSIHIKIHEIHFKDIGGRKMNHIKTINAGILKASLSKPGCKECANSCQSACKTSCTVANLECESESK
jgi:predicted ribosomally synthesized six-cysteine peptide SCIFF